MNCRKFSFSTLFLLVILVQNLHADPYVFDPPLQLSDASQSASNAELCVDPTGNGVAVWSRSDGFNNRIQATQFSINTDMWTTPLTLSAAGITASTPAICCDPNGNAVAVWAETGPGNVRSARYTAATQSWSSPIDVITGGIATADPQVSCDSSGNAIAVWHAFSLGSFSLVIQASRFDAGTMTWSTPTTLSTGGANANHAEVSVDSTGDAAAVWRRAGIIQSSSFDAGLGTWSPPADISSPGSTVSEPHIGIGATGDALAVWERTAPSIDIRAARYNKGTGIWDPPVSIVPSASVNRDPVIAVNDSLQALVVWEGFDGTTVTIRASSYDPATNSWSPVQDVDPGEVTLDVDVAIDNSGNGVALFERFVPPQEAFASCFDLQTNSWSAPLMVSSPGDNIDDPQVQIASTGAIVIALYTKLGVTNVVEAATGLGSIASSGVIPLLLSPTDGVGARAKNRLPFQKEYFNELSWTPSTSTIASGYQIFRNGEFLINLNGKAHNTFRDHNRPKKGTDVYTISTLDVAGGKSLPTTIVVN